MSDGCYVRVNEQTIGPLSIEQLTGLAPSLPSSAQIKIPPGDWQPAGQIFNSPPAPAETPPADVSIPSTSASDESHGTGIQQQPEPAVGGADQPSAMPLAAAVPAPPRLQAPADDGSPGLVPAVISMVLGIVAMLLGILFGGGPLWGWGATWLVSVVPAVPAIVLGVMAKNTIGPGGRGLARAWTGVVLGILGPIVGLMITAL